MQLAGYTRVATGATIDMEANTSAAKGPTLPKNIRMEPTNLYGYLGGRRGSAKLRLDTINRNALPRLNRRDAKTNIEIASTQDSFAIRTSCGDKRRIGWDGSDCIVITQDAMRLYKNRGENSSLEKKMSRSQNRRDYVHHM